MGNNEIEWEKDKIIDVIVWEEAGENGKLSEKE